MKAPGPEMQPYGWAIEYPHDAQTGSRLVTFIANSLSHDRANALDYAVRLHGIVVPLIADRRKE